MEHRLSALLQLHLHSRLNTWLQWVWQRHLQDERRIVLCFGATYIRDFTLVRKFSIGHLFKHAQRRAQIGHMRTPDGAYEVLWCPGERIAVGAVLSERCLSIVGRLHGDAGIEAATSRLLCLRGNVCNASPPAQAHTTQAWHTTNTRMPHLWCRLCCEGRPCGTFKAKSGTLHWLRAGWHCECLHYDWRSGFDFIMIIPDISCLYWTCNHKGHPNTTVLWISWWPRNISNFPREPNDIGCLL